MNIYDLISRAQKLRKETQLDSVSPDRVGGLHEDTLKYINEFQLLASSPSLHKIYASVSAMQSDKSPKSDLTGKPLKPGQLVVIVPANQTDATAGDVYRYDGPSGNTSAWTFVAKIGAVPADAELSATSTNPPQNKVVTEKLTELESYIGKPLEITLPATSRWELPCKIKKGDVLHIQSSGVGVITLRLGDANGDMIGSISDELVAGAELRYIAETDAECFFGFSSKNGFILKITHINEFSSVQDIELNVFGGTHVVEEQSIKSFFIIGGKENVNDSQYKGRIIPCVPGTKFIIKTNNSQIGYALLKSISYIDGIEADFSDNATNANWVTLNGETTFEIKTNSFTNYVWIAAKASGVDYDILSYQIIPSAFASLNISDEVGVFFPLSKPEKIWIVTASWLLNNSGYMGYLFACKHGDIISITANDINSFGYAFLKDINTSVAPNFAGGMEKTDWSVSAGQRKDLVVPEDAKYIWVSNEAGGADYTPKRMVLLGNIYKRLH